MLDFLEVKTKKIKSGPDKGTTEIYPSFIVANTEDLMIRGGDFYAIWDDSKKLWRTDEHVAVKLIDKEIAEFYKTHKAALEDNIKILYLKDSDSKMIDKWHKYIRDQMWENYHPLDDEIIFADTETNRKSYASKKLGYSLTDGDYSAYDEMVSTLYNEKERMKIEWAIGSIVSGDSKFIQKYIVMYGDPGTGKSTILNIIQDLFDGYYATFDSKSLTSNNNTFALEAFKMNPLVVIQQDGDLSHIEDNTKLNSIVSHEYMTVNEKFKSTYTMRFNSFIFMATNKPVKITDAKSGTIRRLIDISPTGNLIPKKRYEELKARIKFEYGAIAKHCLDVYLNNKDIYDDYVAVTMLGATNDFYNFVMDSYDILSAGDGITLKSAWELYKTYCDEAKINYPYSMKAFKEELKNYYECFEERSITIDGVRVRSFYRGFIKDKFMGNDDQKEETEYDEDSWLIFDSVESRFDEEFADCPAQYANLNETPIMKWANVTTTLKDLDTTRLHYVRLPKQVINVDFDLKDENGDKSYEKNVEEARKWPPTYAELSKSGQGIHLTYIYEGDVSTLASLVCPDVEIKVCTGNSSLRRKLCKCCNLPIATINSGLPQKGEKKVLTVQQIQSEKSLRKLVMQNLNKEIHSATKPSVDFIVKILDDAYESGLHYDISDLKNDILVFCANSTHNSDYCLKQFRKMKFKSQDCIVEASQVVAQPIDKKKPKPEELVFYDVEVFPNLFVVVWKRKGGIPVKMVNPSPQEIEELTQFPLVGFNCRRYDNHIMYARLIGYDNAQLYDISQRIINGDKNAFFREAYNLSYTDIYDFSSKKQSLKKFEIELGIHHQELGLPWDQDVAEDLWDKVADYCINDVVATEATFFARNGDFIAREILADIAGGTVNDTTNSLTTRLIFGKERNPQQQFRYRDLSKPVDPRDVPEDMIDFLRHEFPEMMSSLHGEEESLLPYFPGYIFNNGQSAYKGKDVGEGGYVEARPGMYGRTKVFDVASMHPHSATSEYLFGPFTVIFNELMNARVAIKHKDFETAGRMFGGKLKPYLTNPDTAKMLANALKIAINSVYGLTAAKFDNSFRDRRNIDNIVAKRGALFMIDLMEEVEKHGGLVIHIKTDSIKILDPTPEIEDLVYSMGKRYGYTFEVEHIFEKICLVNDAVYIAKCAEDDPESPGEWTATGKQFAVPYVFKTLFTHEPITFADLCETKTVNSNLYLDMNEDQDSLRAEHMKDGSGCVDISGKEEVFHDYVFVGKAGLFCPIKPGCGGGVLLRDAGGKFDSATGAKDYRWLEAEIVEALAKQNDIDTSYYDRQVDEAIAAMGEFGDVEWFRAA